MKKTLGILAIVSISALYAGAASACAPGQKAYHANGEDYCYSQSDGGGQAYKKSSFIEKRIEADKKAHPVRFDAGFRRR